MRPIYPSRSAKSGIVTEDGRFYYCRQCGMVCDSNIVDTVEKYKNFKGIDNNNGDPIVIRGCPFCGTGRSK